MEYEIIPLFYQSGNAEQSVKMSAYMKNNFPFLGIQKPLRDSLEKDFLKNLGKSKDIDWAFVFHTWNLPEREFQYLALDYLVLMKNRLKREDIDQLRLLIEKKPWWDTVDLISSHLVGTICTLYPDLIQNAMLDWADSDNLWLRRSAILFQLKYKEKTDDVLLATIILLNNNSQEFFINKALGWALREYSKNNRDWVDDFIKKHPLHPLTVREGSKYL